MRPPTSSEAVPLTAVPHAPSRRGTEGEVEHATRIRRLFEMTSDLLATISLDGRFTLLNPAWEQALGWSREELMARPMHELIHPDDVEQTLALVLAGSRHPAHLENFTNRYRHRDCSSRWLLWSARCDGATVSMPASVGVSVSAHPEADPEGMLREADVAMYRAKAAGGGRPELFDESLRKEITAHLEIEERLLQALPRQELMLTYQPILPLGGGRAVGCEALVRWLPDGAEHGTIDELLPASFLPRAQDSELIVQIGDWVLNAACAQAAVWHRAGLPVTVSVNVAARQLTELDLPQRVRAALQRARLPGRALCLEVSEESVLR